MRPGERFVGVILETAAEQQLALDSLSNVYDGLGEESVHEDAPERLAQMRAIIKMGGEIALNDYETQHVINDLERRTQESSRYPVVVCSFGSSAPLIKFTAPGLYGIRMRRNVRKFMNTHEQSRIIVGEYLRTSAQ